MGCAHLFLGSLFVLGEGRGGTEGGRVESRLAVSAVLANFRASSVADPRQRLAEALTHAGEVLHARARSAKAFNDTRAGCVAALVRQGRLYAARVGDLRLEIISGGERRSVFDDLGTAGPELGASEQVNVELLEDHTDLLAGDRFLLGNAGLFEAVTPDEIGRIVTTLVPPVAARRLIEAADRGPTPQSVSVQVVQIGDATLIDEVTRQNTAGAPETRSTVPVAPVRLAPQPAAVPPPLRVSPDIELPLPSQRGGMSWKSVIAVLVVLGVGGWLIQRSMRKDDTSKFAERAAAGSTEVQGSADETSEAPAAAAFWDRVDDTLGKSGDTLDPGEVQRWIDDPEQAERTLRNARAVVAALEAEVELEVAVEPEEQADEPETAEDAPESEFEEAPAAEEPDEAEDTPPLEIAEVRTAKPADSAEAGAPRTESTPWKPGRLAVGLRGFERIFAMDDKLKAARLLRGYIHRRHAHVGRVFRSLDQFIEIAPKERTLAVLSKMSQVKPGPKTARWAGRHARRLRKSLGIAP